MDNRSTTIEFKTYPISSDIDDLSQECTAYMKTKQFMARRLHEQQEEIEILKQNVIYLSGKLTQTEDMLLHISSQVRLLKENLKNAVDKQGVAEEFDLSNSELASSFVYEDHNGELQKATPKSEELENLKIENSQLKKDLERSRIEILDSTIQLNKIKSDKFILYNELNELVMSLRKVDIDKLNSFYKINSDKILNKHEMPLAKGIKFNILSAQSQMCKMMITDSIGKKLNMNEEITGGDKLFDKNQMDIYHKILKKNDEDFDHLLDRKLAKKNKAVFLY